jgi:ADP-ribose pyrophosphatase YjhB (NUDIX family)
MKFCSNCGGSVTRRTPQGDNRLRWVCNSCSTIHYQNPKIVIGCVPESDGRILLCKRAIEPRRGYWTVPAGFMELGETIAEGAMRETREEACAEVRLGHLFGAVDVIEAGQLHLFFTATLLGGFAAGDETEDVGLFRKEDIPWAEIAFRSGRFALEKFLEDAGRNNGVHLKRVSRGE